MRTTLIIMGALLAVLFFAATGEEAGERVCRVASLSFSPSAAASCDMPENSTGGDAMGASGTAGPG